MLETMKNQSNILTISNAQLPLNNSARIVGVAYYSTKLWLPSIILAILL
jgi:hypothetical protein